MPDPQLKPGDDSAAEGTDAEFPDDTEQELSPDHAAFLEAMDRFFGRPTPPNAYMGSTFDARYDSRNPAYRIAVEKHLADSMQKQFAQAMQGQAQPGPVFNNSVTPSASSLRQPDSLPAVGKTALMQFLLRMGAGGNPEEK